MVQEDNLVTIELNKQDAELFIWFRKHQDIWARARMLRPGKLILHFNNKNEIGKKEFHYSGECEMC